VLQHGDMVCTRAGGPFERVQQQSAATAAAFNDAHRPPKTNELRQRSSATFLPLDGKEKVFRFDMDADVW
jgi:hypothetical protein